MTVVLVAFVAVLAFGVGAMCATWPRRTDARALVEQELAAAVQRQVWQQGGIT